VDSGAFASETANWVHIRFSHADEAHRALLRDGQQACRRRRARMPAAHVLTFRAPQLTSSLIIGVKPVDPRQREAVRGAWRTRTARVFRA
jgi:hypothetical protein